MAGKYNVVATDFDGTVCKNDIAYVVLQKFGSPSWEGFAAQRDKVRLSFESLLRAQYSTIRAESEAELLQYTRAHYEPREGFSTLARTCADGGTRLVIVSAGLDFCISDFLHWFGLAVDKVICPRTTLTKEGLQAKFPCHRKPARNFKEQAVLNFRKQGLRTVFVGDGYSDVFAASQANAVFAVKGSYLDEQCSKDGINHISMTDFSQVSEFLN